MTKTKIFISDEYDIKKYLCGLVSIKQNYLYNKFYLGGLQIFVKKNKYNEKYYKEFQKIEKQWRYYGCTDDLTEQLRKMSQSDLYEKMPETTRLIYLSCLIEKNNYDEAGIILEQYINKFGLRRLHSILPVAFYACNCGIKSGLLEKSSELWNYITSKETKTSLAEYLKGKKIAVVGGSGCELGRGKGLEIDLHDIVIRFGNYPQGEKYFSDYGKKTNFWVRTSSPDVIHKPDISMYDKVFWKEDFAHIINGAEHLNIMYEYMHSGKLFAADSEDFRKLYNVSGIYRPTAGCMLLWYLYNLPDVFKNVDVYGFAFLSGNYGDTTHYFDNACKISQNHELNKEIDFLQKIYRPLTGK